MVLNRGMVETPEVVMDLSLATVHNQVTEVTQVAATDHNLDMVAAIMVVDTVRNPVTVVRSLDTAVAIMAEVMDLSPVTARNRVMALRTVATIMAIPSIIRTAQAIRTDMIITETSSARSIAITSISDVVGWTKCAETRKSA
jgi:hypothetical protein